VKKYPTFLVSLILSLSLFFTTAYGASSGASFTDDSVQDLSIIVGTSIGGAILGLSTLSFVDEPENHLKNIIVGGAIGIIVGVSVVLWGQAGKNHLAYAQQGGLSPTFDTSARKNWHIESFANTKHDTKAENQSLLFSFNY